MINKIYLENFSAFDKPVELNLERDNRIKKFPDNIFDNNILKTVGIYGPNNTGKTALLNGIATIKDILLNKDTIIFSNLFSKNEISKLGIEFTLDNNTYKYEFSYSIKSEFLYEVFYKINSNTEEEIFLKDSVNKIYKCSKDKNLRKAIENSSKNNILIYTINTENFPILEKVKNILIEIANKITIIDMNKVRGDKTISILKTKNKYAHKVVEFIKSADLFLEDYYYSEDNNKFTEILLKNSKASLDERTIDKFKMVSKYKGIPVPSLMLDSLGTNKIAALASYVVEALEEGKILVIDELDSSLHFKLTRSIVALFNNELNKKAQLICSLHDISLLDCKTLFRKDQIWFTEKDNNGSKLYPLKDFTYYENGVRDTTDIIERYSKGLLGAIPEPDLISILLENDNEI